MWKIVLREMLGACQRPTANDKLAAAIYGWLCGGLTSTATDAFWLRACNPSLTALSFNFGSLLTASRVRFAAVCCPFIADRARTLSAWPLVATVISRLIAAR